MESRDSCELDPSRLDRASDAHVNAEHLLVSACTGKLICQLTFGFSNSFYRNLLFVICPFPNFLLLLPNFARLDFQVLLNDVIESIFDSAHAAPPVLRYICGCLQKSVSSKWPENEIVRTRVVSVFIFLRLLSPAIR